MAVHFRFPVDPFISANVATGALTSLALGSVMFCAQNTLTLATIYTDNALTIPDENPITLDSVGQVGNVYGADQIYRVIVKNAAGSIVPGGDFDWDAGDKTTVYIREIFIEGKPTADEVYPISLPAFAQELRAGLPLSRFAIAVPPTATMTFLLQKNGTNIGSVVFSTLGVPTVTFATTIPFSTSDNFSLVAQHTPDATGAAISWTFVFHAT